MDNIADFILGFNGGKVQLTNDPEHATTGADFNAGGPRRKTYPGNIPVKRGRPPKKKE